MAKWLVLVETNCSDPTLVDQFNKWYDEVHLPDMLETQGLVRATRYERITPAVGQARYLAAYEVEADDLALVMKQVQENMQKKGAAGRMSPLMQIAGISNFKQISSLPKR